MKHIKRHFIFESTEFIKQDLQDIFLEVNDDINWEAKFLKKWI